jgi:RNA polymerase sigma factor (sigma-70 family)
MPEGQLENAVCHPKRTMEFSNAPQLTDGQLLDCYVSCRDESAFAILIRRYGRLVRSVCRHILHHEQDIDDAFQATWMIFVSKADSIRKSASVSSWLYGVAYRTAMNAKRARIRRFETQSDPKGRASEQPVTEAALREVQAILDEEVQHLSDKHRAPFILCCLEGKNRAEAATQLGLKEGTVSSRLAQARKELQMRLARRGIVLAAALCLVELSRNGAAASVSPALVQSTIEGARYFAAGKAAAANFISSQAALLAKGATKATAAKKLTMAMAVLLAIGLAAGASRFARQALATMPAAEQQQNSNTDRDEDKDSTATATAASAPSPATFAGTTTIANVGIPNRSCADASAAVPQQMERYLRRKE